MNYYIANSKGLKLSIDPVDASFTWVFNYEEALVFGNWTSAEGILDHYLTINKIPISEVLNYSIELK